jgi:demethylmenaquinone methyltransferase/2-methoxy-6-polyprenyl-1,4-benzoquinol methylase
MMNGESKKERVERMFNDIAPTYDALNHILSLSIDHTWRKKVVKMAADFMRGNNSPRPSLLDVATGTGDLAIALAAALPGAQVTGVDISERMLAIGREKVAKMGTPHPLASANGNEAGEFSSPRGLKSSELSARITLQTGDAERLDFPDGTFDVVTVAFGVRNFGDRAAGLREMRRVLRRGGRCLVLEFSEPRRNTLFGAVYHLYFHRVLPLVGRLVSRNGRAYSYLPDSVDGFPTPGQFAAEMGEAGFFNIKTHKLTFGISYIYETES